MLIAEVKSALSLSMAGVSQQVSHKAITLPRQELGDRDRRTSTCHTGKWTAKRAVSGESAGAGVQ